MSTPYKLFLECQTDEDCSVSSDTCHEHICRCGANAKCTKNTDTCEAGVCKCGENDECPETQYCNLGECKGIYFQSPNLLKYLLHFPFKSNI